MSFLNKQYIGPPVLQCNVSSYFLGMLSFLEGNAVLETAWVLFKK